MRPGKATVPNAPPWTGAGEAKPRGEQGRETLQ